MRWLLLVLASCGSSSNGAALITASAPDAGLPVEPVRNREAMDAAAEAYFYMDLCDRDRDGYRAIGEPCGGDDCDDDDPRAHPGVPFSHEAPAAKTKGDWNCNDQIEFEVTEFGVDCATRLSTCVVSRGYTALVGCAETGTYVKCGVQNGACVAATSIAKTQGCR